MKKQGKKGAKSQARTFVFKAVKLERATERRCRDYSIKIDERSIGLFSSRAAAEKAVAKCVKDYASAAESGWGASYQLAGFFVEKYALDGMLSRKDTWTDVVEATWSYDKDGRPVSYSPFSTDYKDGRYSGTSPDAIKFKKGDYVYAYARGRFTPARVDTPPFTPEEWKKKFKFASDASDDCYLVMCAGGHDHPQTVNVFPLDVALPAAVVAKIDAAEDEYYGRAAEKA